MSVSSINSAMNSGRIYCASPPARSIQSPPGQSSMQADPSAYAPADNSLSPSSEPSWWDNIVQGIQTHVPETIIGLVGTAGTIALGVWAFKGRGGGKKGVETPSPSYTPSSSGSPSSNPRRTAYVAPNETLAELRTRASEIETKMDKLKKDLGANREWRNLFLGETNYRLRSPLLNWTGIRPLFNLLSPPVGQRAKEIRIFKENKAAFSAYKDEYSQITREINRRVRNGQS